MSVYIFLILPLIFVKGSEHNNKTSDSLISLTRIHFLNSTSINATNIDDNGNFFNLSISKDTVIKNNSTVSNLNYTLNLLPSSSIILTEIKSSETKTLTSKDYDITSSTKIEINISEISVYSDANNQNIIDNSLNNIPIVKNLLKEEKFQPIFSQEFVKNINDQSKLSEYFNSSYRNMIAQKTDGENSFFKSGEKKRMTKSNCYIIRIKENSTKDIFSDLESVLKSINGEVKKSFRHGIKGYSICFPDGILPLNLLKSIPWISYIERDQIISYKQIQNNAPWGLSRLTDPTNLNGNQFSFNLTGEGVNIYTLDSGIWIQHKEFGSRGSLVFSTFGAGLNYDCSGHGTEVASVAAGLRVGVAKKANIMVAQVLDCEGQGQNSDLVSALDWIISNHKKPAVLNLSVGGPPSKSVDDAVNAVISRGVPVVVAAGNSGLDACTQSPSRVDSAIVVGASNESNERASFSNFGNCVDIFAPGTNIYAASIPKKSTEGYSYVSGTSLSAPFVSGIIALRLQQFPHSTPLEIYNWVINNAKSGILLENSLYSSPNLFVRLVSSPSKELVNFNDSPILKPSIPTNPSSKLPLGIIFISIGSILGASCFLWLLIWGIKTIKRRIEKKNIEEIAPRDGVAWSSRPFL
jgi:hypothetical protein